MVDYSQCTVLVVDDNKKNIDVVLNTLRDICDVSTALSGRTALQLARKSPPDLILLDVMMPDLDGFEVCRILKKDPQTAEIPVLFLTGMTDVEEKLIGFDVGAVDYIIKPFEPVEMIARVKTHMALAIAKKELKAHNDILEEKVTQRTKELALTQEITIDTLAGLAEYRDPETGGHIQRTKNYVQVIADIIKDLPEYSALLNSKTINLIVMSAPLHDIGKVGTPDHILLKPGKLTPEEFEIMKIHTTIGYATLQRAEKKLGYNSFLTYAKEIAWTHHEKWDGSGYPNHLKGNEIPIPGRIMAIADVYDALISKRVYKPPFPHTKALSIMTEGRGTQFDPLMFDMFIKQEHVIRTIAQQFADSDEEHTVLTM
ncbi:MAG TPA: two-component system response regulator [Chitinispirillaceae bacterium]|nr:two-component system response regulator [Chitinispirillaceae bacterium]